jgi:hypothetical protein
MVRGDKIKFVIKRAKYQNVYEDKLPKDGGE